MMIDIFNRGLNDSRCIKIKKSGEIMKNDWQAYQILPNCNQCIREGCPIKSIRSTKLVKTGGIVLKIEKCKICLPDGVDEFDEPPKLDDLKPAPSTVV